MFGQSGSDLFFRRKPKQHNRFGQCSIVLARIQLGTFYLFRRQRALFN